MNQYFKRAYELETQLIKDRRTLHQYPELGLELPKTKAYIKNRLKEMNIDAFDVGVSGLGAIIEGANPGKTFLLRSDMDALPMEEINNLDFKSRTNAAHNCGHDLHMAMLLTAAQILSENKKDIFGRVKLMFQPGEEIFAGAQEMIDEGILENPKPDAAFAIHTGLDDTVGSYGTYEGYITTSCDVFQIKIKGQGGHGAYPHTTIDPINVGTLIHQQFNQLIAREVDPFDITTLTFGMFSGGTNSNIIPETVKMQGTLRTYDPKLRIFLNQRMQEIIVGLEKVTGARIDYKITGEVPALYSDPQLTKELKNILKKANKNLKAHEDVRFMASEDMALISEIIPTMFILLNCKVEGNDYSHHNPNLLFDEKALALGAGIHATSAIEWLSQNQN